MRVTDGTLRRKQLRHTDSGALRPTARRLRETLFDFLTPHITGARFLDLCAGTGAVGIEALSRGAQHVTFIEREAQTCKTLRANLATCGIKDTQFEIVQDDAAHFLAQADAHAPWDISFFDPPYATDYLPALELLGAHADTLLAPGGVLVVEHHHKNALKDAAGRLRRWRIITMGQSCLSFYERRR